MKKNYNPKKLNKKQRHLKKWIPNSVYCDDCPFWFDITNKVKHNRELCDFKCTCTDNCDTCDEIISYCAFLNYAEYGQYPLGDGCKVCSIKEYNDSELNMFAKYELRTCIDETYINSKAIKRNKKDYSNK